MNHPQTVLEGLFRPLKHERIKEKVYRTRDEVRQVSFEAAVRAVVSAINNSISRL